MRPKTVADESAAERIYRMSIDYIRTIYRYRVKKYPGRIALIVSEELYDSNKSMGWNGVAVGGLEIHRTPGDHSTRYELHSKELAKRLLGCLERAQAAHAPTESSLDHGTGIKKADALLHAAMIVSAITSSL